MAYTLNDPYRGLRLALRINAVLAGLGWGGLLLAAPQLLQTLWAPQAVAASWVLRLGGAGLIAMGLCFLEVAQRPTLSRLALVAIACSNATLGGVLFHAYVTDAIAPPELWGRLLLLVLFLSSLMCAALPWAYLGEDLQP